MNISTRINRRLDAVQTIDNSITNLLELAGSKARFDSPEAFQAHLTEGALLNINKLASDCLSIPSGKYIVWLTDSGKTVLAPARYQATEVHGKVKAENYEVHTPRLVGMWNRLERNLIEAPEIQDKQDQDVGGHYDAAPEQMPDEPYTFGTNIGRPALWQAMQRAGVGVSELANMIGVDKSTVSRLLRDVQDGPGDPHGRNPSVAVAQKIAQVLGVDVNEVLPPPEDLAVTMRSGTTGSGNARGQNAKQMTQGGQGGVTAHAAQEDRVRDLARLMAECKVNPVQCITDSLIGIPEAEPVLNEFLGGMFGKNKPVDAAAQDSQLFDTAIKAISTLIQTYSKNGFTARVGDKKMKLDQWLSSIARNLVKIKAKMPEVKAKHASPGKPDPALLNRQPGAGIAQAKARQAAPATDGLDH